MQLGDGIGGYNCRLMLSFSRWNERRCIRSSSEYKPIAEKEQVLEHEVEMENREEIV